MNGLNDSHKRTSISQLLNPASREPTSLASGQTLTSINSVQPQQQHQPSQYQNSFQNSFHLRAASWDQVRDDPTKRRSDNATSSSRPYHHPQMNTVDVYGDHPHRPRLDDPNNFAMDGSVPVWTAAHEIANIAYGAPIVPHMYSDERTALSGDYGPNNHYNHGYQEQPQSNIPPPSWQVADRNPIQLVAREAPIEQQHQMQYAQQPPYFAQPNVPFGIIPFQPPVQTRKRPSEPVEEVSPPKAKKGKTKAKAPAEGTSGPSKRGYNAKKRSEAAQIAAQNAQLMPSVSYTQMPGEKGKEKAADAPMRIVSDDAVQPPGAETSVPLRPELQFARCMSNRYRSEQFPRCVSCTRRWAGDTCRFQGIRFFLKDATRKLVGISFVETQKADAPNMNFPNKWNVNLESSHIRRTKKTIAQALLPTLRQELEHLQMSEIIRRPRESEVRATCDTCMTSIFSRSWMCRLCGRESCAECFDQVKELTEDRPGAGQAEIAALQARREKHAHTNPFFLACTKRNEHRAKDFSPMSRFCNAELEQVIKDMEFLLCTPDPDAVSHYTAVDPMIDGQNPHLVSTSAPSPTNIPELTPSSYSTTDSTGVCTPPDLSSSTSMVSKGAMSDPSSQSSTSVVHGGSVEEIPSHPTRRFSDPELTDDVFRPIWARGEPLVVTGLLEKFRIRWTPEYFIEKYSTQSCLVIECQTDVNKRVTVGEFFSWFGKYENRTECWKLKDWPPSADFRIAFPDLYEDISSVVPVPNYVRRDGVLNVASHFPSNTVAPDLGPKMYNSTFSSQSSGSKGSTRLHMDMADTLNVMTFASPAPDGSPGCAAWDIYRAEDSDKLRQFLRKRFPGSFQHDPIHSQQFYLDTEMRKELYDICGVKSHRIFQRPGDALLIPAGCAHQVSNMSDCIKVAVDFVSPENVARCEKLIREFREQNPSVVWREDVLQLRTMMWFAWLSCCRQEGS